MSEKRSIRLRIKTRQKVQDEGLGVKSVGTVPISTLHPPHVCPSPQAISLRVLGGGDSRQKK